MAVIICRPIEPEGETLPLPMDYYDFYNNEDVSSTTSTSDWESVYYDDDGLSTPNEGSTTTTSTSDLESHYALTTIIEEEAKTKSRSKSRPKSRSRSKSKAKNEKESKSSKTTSKMSCKKKSKSKQTKPDPPDAHSSSTPLRLRLYSSLIPTKREVKSHHNILMEAEASILNAIDPAERKAFLEEQRQVLEEIEQERASHEMALAMNSMNRKLKLDDSSKLSQDESKSVHGDNIVNTNNKKVHNGNTSKISLDSGKGGMERDKAPKNSKALRRRRSTLGRLVCKKPEKR